MAGGARRSARSAVILAAAAAALSSAGVIAQELYKYLGPDGEWIYSDRPPGDGRTVEIRQLETRQSTDSGIKVTHRFEGRTVSLVAKNESYAPVELALEFTAIRGLQFPHPDDELSWVVAPRSELALVDLDLNEGVTAPYLEYQYRYLAGDPGAVHDPQMPYRAPYVIATSHPVTQAHPNVVTHRTRDSYHAVDMAMPIGTDIVAARGGVVFDVASNNFTGGLDPERDGPNANVVRILHDDGSYAIYAHLNTNSIRVKPGDVVQRGEYIADSGNTGFSSGPHLHFAVVVNAGMEIHSVPVVFMGPNQTAVVPRTGMELTAY